MTLKYKIENQILHCVGNLRPTIELSKNRVYLDLTFDSEWDGASVTVTFEHTSLPDRVVPVLWTGEPVAVPPEVLVTGELRIGCIGLADNGETRLTTARMTRGIYLHRAGSALLIAEGAESTTPALWEQVLAALGTLSDLNTADKSNLVAAVNEVLSKVGTGGSGTIDPDEIAAAVEDYLSANPPAQGEPGVSPTVDISKSGNATTVTITDATGPHTATIYDGENGLPGEDGRGVASVSGNADGSWTITYTDGTTEPISSEAYEALASMLSNCVTVTDTAREIIFCAAYPWVAGYFDVTGHFNGAYYYRIAIKQWFPVTPGAYYAFDTHSDYKFLIRGYNGTTGYNIIGTLVSLQSKCVIKIPENVTYITITISADETTGDSTSAINDLLKAISGKTLLPTVTKLAVAPGPNMDITEEGVLTGDFIAQPPSAEVGQTIQVSAIDENGKPTAWEVVDFPQGETGSSGIYVGAGEPPEGYAVQIDPNGEADNVIKSPATATVGQTIRVSAVDTNGKPTAWEAVDFPVGSEGRAWELLAEIDISDFGGETITLAELDNFTDFYATWETVINESATASGYNLSVNNIALANQTIPIWAAGTAANFGWMIARYNGLVWEVQRSNGATQRTLITLNSTNGLFPYNHVLGVGKANTIALEAPVVSAYRAVSGIIKIYGR